MRILAIGATGFIGLHVVCQLTQQGHDVAVFHRGTTETNLPDSTQSIYGDRDTLSEFKGELRRFAPDVVLDVVPYTEEQIGQEVGVFDGLARRLVIVSSSDVYRNYDGLRGASNHAPDPVPLSERAPLRKELYPYRGYKELDFKYADKYEKILVERAAKSGSKLSSTILRLPAVYGEGDKQHRFLKYLKRMLDRRPAILVQEEEANWRWTHGYVQNVAAAIALAVIDERAAGQTYNVGEQQTPTVVERIEALGAATDWQGEVIFLPKDRMPEHLRTDFNWQYDMETDSSRIREELGYVEPVSEPAALARTIGWEREVTSTQELIGSTDYAAEDEAIKNAV